MGTFFGLLLLVGCALAYLKSEKELKRVPVKINNKKKRKVRK